MMYVLKQHRMNKGYSCEAISRKLGISKTYYWQIEQGKRRITYDLALKMAQVYKTTPDTLLYKDTITKLTKQN